MKSIFIEDLSKEEIDKILSDRPVIFTGSFVSTYLPTGLSNGETFCRELFDYIFPDYLETEFAWLRKEFGKMPFEALMECFPNQESLPDILQKIYRKEKYNSLHESIVNYLISGKITALVTPNYDLAFDTCLREKGFDQMRIIRTEKEFSRFKNRYFTRAFFKIHGTAEDGYKDTMVYTLSQESDFKEWKLECMQRLVKDRDMIFIGYSGRDFDICPLLADTEKYQYKKIIWLKRSLPSEEAPLSHYSDFLLKRKSENILLIGDIEKFSRIILKENHSLKTEENNSSVFFHLTDAERFQWKLKILSRMSCATLMRDQLRQNSSLLNKKYLLVLQHELFGNTGEYLQAALKMQELLKITDEKSKDYIKWLTWLSSSLLSSGHYMRSRYYLQKAIRRVKKFFPDDPKFTAMLLNRRIVNWMVLNQYLEKFPLPGTLKNFAKNKARKLMRQYPDIMMHAPWDDKQMIQHSLERLGISDELNIILPSRTGYSNLGLSGMDAIAFRDTVRKLPEVSESQTASLRKYIETTERLGMSTELWKHCKILVTKSKLPNDIKLQYWMKWKKHLPVSEHIYPRRIYNRIVLTYSHYKLSRGSVSSS